MDHVNTDLDSNLNERNLSSNTFSDKDLNQFESIRFNHNLYYRFTRFLELLLIVIFFIPVLLVISFCGVLIKIDSNGPIFYKHLRVGKDMKTFTMYKLRSMYFESEKGQEFTVEADYRITKIGRILRRFRLDELPQIFNILKGEMSLIGPRPLSPYEYKNTDLIFEKRTIVFPGITGLAQVSGGNNLNNLEKFKYDMDYITKMNFKLDLLILIKTVGIIMTGKGYR